MTPSGRRDAPRRAAAAIPSRAAARALALALTAALAACAPLPHIVVLEDPLSAEEHVALGVAYERRDELGPAAREYERALTKDRASFRARLNLANVRLAQKRYAEARTEYLRAIALRPGDSEATNNLAWVAILSGDGREEALRRLDAVLAGRTAAAATSDGLTPVLLDTRGVLLGNLGRRAEADEALARAAEACLAARCPEPVLTEIRAHQEALRRSPSP